MFAVYKKIISPDTSPVLGPASPNLTPMMNANNNANNNVNTNNNVNNNAINANTNNNANNNANTNNNAINANTNASVMESLSLCNYCCSPRNKLKKDDAPAPAVQHPEQRTYEFGHATHYVYGVTTPRLLCDFETGTPPSP
jgi:hypothetical protein